MRLIVILALTALASTLVVASDSCDLGPAFWCENRDNARICSAVEYCTAFVWKTQNVEAEAIDSSTDSCQDCTKFFVSLKSFLSIESLTFAQDLIVERICKTMGEYRQQCETSVKSLLPSIFKFLISQINPKTACKKAQLCQREEQDSNSEFDAFFVVNWGEILDDSENLIGTTKICTDCKKFVDAAKNLGKQFQPLVKDLTVKMVCSKFRGSIRLECEVIASILPSAFGSALKYIDSTKACGAAVFRMCSKTNGVSDSDSDEDSVELHSDNRPSPLENIANFAMKEWNYDESTKICLDCQKFFIALVRLLQNEALNYTQDVILDKVCPLTRGFKKQCEELTKKFLPLTVKGLLSMINPKKTCTVVKACPKKTLEEQDNIPSDFESQLDSIDFEELSNILQQNLNASKCEVCKWTLAFIREAIKAFRGPFEAILDNVVCSLLGPAQLPCKMIVKTLVPTIFNALDMLLKNPEKICRFFRLCPRLDASIDESFLNLDAPQENLESELVWSVLEEPANADECLICQKIAQDFENLLKLDETAICQEFSQQEKPTCVSLVKTFNPALINRLTAVVSPKFFCEKARICPTAKDFGRFNRE